MPSDSNATGRAGARSPPARAGAGRPWRRRVWAALVAGAAASCAHAQEAEPFAIRNLNPLTAVFGLPTWGGVPDGVTLALTSDLANHYRLSERGPERLVLDGETWRTGLRLEAPFGEGWSVAVEAPYVRQSGGVLDDLIDGWHAAFGLPDGGRNLREEDALLFALANGAGPFFRLDRREGGWGDAQIGLARRIGADGGFVVRATAKLATGEESLLAGSGSTDWSLTLFRSASRTVVGRPFGYYWGVGVLRLGAPERIEFDAERAAYVGLVGGGWQVWPRFGLKAQLDVHGALYDSRLEEIGEDAVQATFGAFARVGRRGLLELAIVEDVAVSTSPDVVLHARLRWALGSGRASGSAID
ncbi:MAG TPA: DUF3187 family protein [Gammaproteobacteria bacterium]